VAACLVVGSPEGAPKAGLMAGVAVLMAVWWIFEVVPIPVTSLFPLVLLPGLDITTMAATSANYGKPTIFLFLGGFLLALGLQRSGLHKRLALGIMARVGSRPSRLILGFMLATAALSMWISNTASVMVMLPVALSVLDEVASRGTARSVVAKLGVAVMLGVAYAADIGGMATPVGTPPNMVLMELHTQLFPDAPPFGFGQWILMGLPLAVVFLAAAWLLLTKLLFRFRDVPLLGSGSVIAEARVALGPVRRDEIGAGAVFAMTALLWMTGSDIDLGSRYLPGWRGALGLEGFGDASVAIAAACLLFVIPSADRPGERLMDWQTALEVPWGILLLFGGGFALAAGFQSSGLSVEIGEQLARLEGAPPLLVVIVVCLGLTFLTELTSTTATTNLVLPILAPAGGALGIDPRVLMIPATLSASCAFMMPVASPTQAIVFGSGYVSIRQMVRAGIWFNLIGVLLVTLVFFLIGVPVFSIDLSALPSWAR